MAKRTTRTKTKKVKIRKTSARKPLKKTAKKTKKTAKRTLKKPRAAKKSARKPATRKSKAKKLVRKPTRKRSRLGKLGTFAKVYLWLVLIDAVFGIVSLLTSNQFIQSPLAKGFAVIYAFGFFILSVIALFVFIAKKLPRPVILMPAYMVVGVILLVLLSAIALTTASPGGIPLTETPIVLMGLMWVFVAIELVLSGWLLTQYK